MEGIRKTLMANYERDAKLDWEKLKADIQEWFGDSRRKITGSFHLDPEDYIEEYEEENDEEHC